MWAAAKGALSAGTFAQVVVTVMGSDGRAPLEDNGSDEEDASADAVRELEKIVRKATSNTSVAPEEQKLLHLVAAASEPQLQPHLQAVLAHRLRGCGSSRMLDAAAKTLLIIHRLLLAGYATLLEQSVLADLPHVLSSVDAHAEAEAEYVRGCIDYLAHLIDWPSAAQLRRPADCGATLAQLPTLQLVEALPPLLELAHKALACAAVEPPSRAALRQLWLGMVEDALCLFRAAALAAARLHAVYLGLPPRVLQEGRVLEAMHAFALLAPQALMLQERLGGEFGAFEGSEVLESMLKRRAVWPSGPPPDHDLHDFHHLPAGGTIDTSTAEAAAEAEAEVKAEAEEVEAAAAQMQAQSQLQAQAQAQAERGALLRLVLEQLPAAARTDLVHTQLPRRVDADLGLSRAGRGAEQVSISRDELQISQDELRRLDVATVLRAVHASRAAAAEAQSTSHEPPASAAATGAAGAADAKAAAAAANEAAASSEEAVGRTTARLLLEGLAAERDASQPVELRPALCGGLTEEEVGILAYEQLLLCSHLCDASLPRRVGELRRRDGARVRAVARSSAAAAAGITPGALVLRVNGQPVPNGHAAEKALVQLSGHSCLVLTLRGSGGPREVTLTRHYDPLALVRHLPHALLAHKPNSGRRGPSAASAAATASTAAAAIATAVVAAASTDLGISFELPSQREDEWPGATAGTGSAADGGGGSGGGGGGCSIGFEPSLLEEVLDLVRVRLGVTVRRHDALLPLLRAPLLTPNTTGVPDAHDAPSSAAGLPDSLGAAETADALDDETGMLAYRGRLLLHAQPPPDPAAAVGSGEAGVGGGEGNVMEARARRRHELHCREVAAFGERQLALLCSALLAAGSGGDGGGSGRVHARGGVARLRARAERLLELLAVYMHRRSAGCASSSVKVEGSGEAQPSGGAAAAAAVATETGATADGEGGGGGGGGEVGGGEAGAVEAARVALRQCLGEVGLDGGCRWPLSVGFRLYCALLETCYEPDEPSQLAGERPQIEAVLRVLVWGPLRIHARSHALATLAVHFDCYQRSGSTAAVLLPVAERALRVVLGDDTILGGGGGVGGGSGGEAAAAEAEAATAAVSLMLPVEPADEAGWLEAEEVQRLERWLAHQVDGQMAGMVGYLAARLRDYPTHFELANADGAMELAWCAALWRRCVLALHAGDTVQLAEQAAALVRGAVTCHVHRLRRAVAAARLPPQPAATDSHDPLAGHGIGIRPELVNYSSANYSTTGRWTMDRPWRARSNLSPPRRTPTREKALC